MADENKIDQKSDALENLSPEELRKRIQEEKKNAKRSLRFAFTALIAIIAVCIAWFMSNTRVTMTGTQISAGNTISFELASIGSRQDAEEKRLVKDDTAESILSAGTSSTDYSKCIDIYTGQEETFKEDQSGKYPEFHTGTSGLAWYLNGQENLVPGAGGKLEFYLIPKKSGLTSVTISLNLEGYTEQNNKAVKLDNKKIQNLLKGHILFFQHLDDKYGYYGWMGDSPSVTINAPETGQENAGKTGAASATFQKDVPYKVTLYWKWPQYFRNYIYTQRSTYGDLFTDELLNQAKYKEEYDSLIKFINNQKNISSSDSQLFYDMSNKSDNSISDNINAEMSDTVLNNCSTYYNQADEYIGTNTQYVYIQINID